jgi:type IV secretory pathway VirB6-like protein
MTKPTSTHWMLAWLLTLGILVMFYPPLVYAVGDDVTVGAFGCSGGTATGQLILQEASCPTILTFDNVFSFLVCNMQQMASNILGHLYCNMLLLLTPSVWAMISIAVLLAGIMFSFGLIAATGGEAIAFMLKIAFVVGFATEADTIIGVGYRLLMSAMTDGVAIILNGMGVTGATSGAGGFALLDGFLKKIMDYAVGGFGSPIGADKCRDALFAVIATMAIAFPLAAYFALALIGKIVMSLFRAIFAYVYALFGVTFLMALSPIFVSFYLFKPTQQLFNKWLGYMVSMIVQVVMLFAFLTFILSMNVSTLTDNLTNIIMYQEQSAESDTIRMPWKYCTLCDFRVADRNNTSVTLTPYDPNYIQDATLVCNVYTVNLPSTPGYRADLPTTNSAGHSPLNITLAVSPNQASGQIDSLLKLAGEGILALIVLAIVVDRLLALLPMLAQRLGMGLGASYAPQMGGGDGIVAAPGSSLARDFSTGFSRTYRETSSKDGLTSSVEAVKNGITGMITGRAGGRDLYTGEAQKQAGISWQRWISNPHDFGK